ncbi:hypothetical protein C7K25_03565 [Gulosibacter molinativorax]|uniref:GyrI-like small molecule binding domain-containing protein n=2 Tax=Gulosibacter molinativorax TaxID=256821 RepID=A0ABT7C5K4_9MICO|nr:GyrI-like domain-containing protein [Gulosibacter molinativorax]MDJ1370459.1 hypothetical protein [Gulosibacter molinativorax]
MDNLDLKRVHRELYTAKRGQFTLVEVPELVYLQVDGHGDPNSSAEYGAALQALYTVSYGARRICKTRLERKHTVAPLEGLWTAADMSSFVDRRKDDWDWTMMIAQPDYVTAEIIAEAIEDARAKSLAALDRLRFGSFEEGLSVQTLHVGPYDDEGPVLQRMHEEFIPEQGLEMTGSHHEVYLSDARKTVPEKLRTILRQPVRRRENG